MDGKVALVVGAGPGVGRACAFAFARDGADVVVAARRPGGAGRAGGGGGGADRASGRARSSPTCPICRSCVGLVDEAVARLGGVDALVTVATTGGGQTPIDEVDWDVWRRAFEVNVIGTLEVSRCAARSMATRGGGSIVHIGTFGTHSLPARQAAYTATKQAALTASKTLAKELGRPGHPGERGDPRLHHR